MKCFPYCVCFVLLIFISSCRDDLYQSNSKTDPPKDYYPMEIGNYWIYKVDSTYYTTVDPKVRTVSKYFKEEIVDFYLDTNRDTIFKLEVSISDSISGLFTITDIWSCYLEDDKVIKNEENLAFIKMIDPINKNVPWSGNSKFNYLEVEPFVYKGGSIELFTYIWSYKYLDSPYKKTILGTQTDVVDIELAQNENPTSKTEVYESYAKNIGLISRIASFYSTNCIECINDPWEQKVEHGIDVEFQLVEYEIH